MAEAARVLDVGGRIFADRRSLPNHLPWGREAFERIAHQARRDMNDARNMRDLRLVVDQVLSMLDGCCRYAEAKREELAASDQMRAVLDDERRRAAELLDQAVRERLQLAKLAADEPQFFSPLRAYEARAVRDRVLRETREANHG
ncbi:MAG TPA: hypothetical protein VFS08_06240 [Gemmatimonadaceae bacterium]|nr:hypothetical protein [Gemmatimonadaceae bacterium]